MKFGQKKYCNLFSLIRPTELNKYYFGGVKKRKTEYFYDVFLGAVLYFRKPRKTLNCVKRV